MKALHRTYLDGTDLERGNEMLMRFRLTYEGPLLSSNPLPAEDIANPQYRAKRQAQQLRRLAHKHRLRQCFHKQLKEFWETNRFLTAWKISPDPNADFLPPAPGWVWGPDKEPQPAAKVLAARFGHDEFGYVPLVRKDIFLACSLRVLCLRRDHIEAVGSARDLDNRIKTLIDALTWVPHKDGGPIDDEGNPVKPGPGEDPFFYVLLDDDRQVTHLEVETDTALSPSPEKPEDESFVRLVITVEIRPYSITMSNLSFS